MFAYELTAGQKFKITTTGAASPTIYTCVTGKARNNRFAKYPGVVGRDESGAQHGFGEYHTVELVTPAPIIGIEFGDTDSGLGIGGIGNDQSMPVIPSARAISRVQRMRDTDIVCKKCGASKNFDGAMFTTNAGSGICDDCI